MDDSDPATAASLDDLAACLRHVHLLADKQTFWMLKQQITHANGLLPGTGLKRTRLTRTTVSDILLGRKFPGKAFLLTFVDACGVDLEVDHRWEQAWDRLAPQYQQAPAPSEVDWLRQESEELRQEKEKLRQQLTASGDRAAAIADLVENAIPDDCALPRTWPICAALLPLAQAILADDSAGLDRLADYLGWSRSFAGARDLQQRVFHARARVLGPEHPDTLTARARFAYWTGKAGGAAAARDQFARLIPDLARVLGPEHPDTLAAAANLATMTGSAGDAAAARDQLARLIPDLDQILGPEHPDTLAAAANLATMTGSAGDAAAARDQLARLIPDLERILSPEHPQTLAARSHLAYWAGEAEDAAAARDMFTRLVPDLERVLSREHPDTLYARVRSAYWTGAAGDAAAAQDVFARLFPDLERVLGPEHPDTLAARSHLASLTGNTEDDAAVRGDSHVPVPMPQPGKAVFEGTVTRWLKKEGERVEVEEPLLEVSTDKVDIEIASPATGILRGIAVDEDETVAVGTQLAVIELAESVRPFLRTPPLPPLRRRTGRPASRPGRRPPPRPSAKAGPSAADRPGRRGVGVPVTMDPSRSGAVPRHRRRQAAPEDPADPASGTRASAEPGAAASRAPVESR